MTTLCKYIPE